MSENEIKAEQITEMDTAEGHDESHEALNAHLAAAGVSAEERYHLISKEAYYRAERRGFIPGAELEDWLAAETEIDTMIRKIAADIH